MASISDRAILPWPKRTSARGSPQMNPEQKRDYLITYVADVIVLAQAADQHQLANRGDVKQRIEFERHKALMEALLQDAGKAGMTDDAMQKVYDEAIKQT